MNSLHYGETGCVAHPCRLPIGYGGSCLLGVKGSELEADHASAEVWNGWNLVFFPPSFMAWCLATDCFNFYFLYLFVLFIYFIFYCVHRFYDTETCIDGSIKYYFQ
jgi:hypothetical protein